MNPKDRTRYEALGIRCTEPTVPVGKPTRLVSGTEVRDLYDALGNIGIQLCYRHSKDMPQYKGTTADGVELFEHEGRTIPVAPGQIIDDSGNVVNPLSARLALFDHFMKRTQPKEKPYSMEEKGFSKGYLDMIKGKRLETIELPYLRDKRRFSDLRLDDIIHPERNPLFSKPIEMIYVK